MFVARLSGSSRLFEGNGAGLADASLRTSGVAHKHSWPGVDKNSGDGYCTAVKCLSVNELLRIG